MSAVLLRRAWKEKININPFYIVNGILYPVIDNGYGELVEDKKNPEQPYFESPVRVGYIKKWIMKRDEGSTPIYVERRVYHMISDHETEIDIGLEFGYKDEVMLKVMNRKVIRKYNTIIGYEYEMKDITRGQEYYG